MKENETLKNLIKHNQSRVIIPKTNRFNNDIFEHKFSTSLLKILGLKGINYKLEHTQFQAINGVELDSFKDEFVIKEIFYEGSVIGMILYSKEFIGELIHKMMGGADSIVPGAPNLPLSSIQEKTLNSFDGAMANAIREAIKSLIPTTAITLSAPLDQVSVHRIINSADSFFYNTFDFNGLQRAKIATLLKFTPFNRSQRN